MVQNRGLEGGWAALGHLLGGSWAKPGSKAPLGRLLEDIQAALGRFLNRLGRLLGGLGGLWAFWRPHGPNLAARIHENPSKIDAKMHFILESIFS